MYPNLQQKQLAFKKKSTHSKTLVLSLDGVLTSTTIFKETMAKVDGKFLFNNIEVYVQFRPYLHEFIRETSKIFELVLWSSSQLEYSKGILKIVEENLGIKFDHFLTFAD